MAQYSCVHCGGPCGSSAGWSEADADAERLSVFGQPRAADDVVLCGTCYREFRLWWSALPAEQRVAPASGEAPGKTNGEPLSEAEPVAADKPVETAHEQHE